MPAPDIFGLPTVNLSILGVVQVDAVITERHRFENLVTEHPVEDGSPRTDHIVNLPVKLEMDGRITDTPSDLGLSLVSGAAGLIGSQIGLDPAAVALGSSLINAKLPGRAKSAYQELVSLYQRRTVFDVVTGLNVYQNMTFVSLIFPRARQDGRSVRFEAILQELIVVGTDPSSNAERIANEVENTAVEPLDVGFQALELLSFIV